MGFPNYVIHAKVPFLSLTHFISLDALGPKEKESTCREDKTIFSAKLSFQKGPSFNFVFNFVGCKNIGDNAVMLDKEMGPIH